VIDGLGHGPSAHEAAEAVARAVGDPPIEEVLERCAASVRGTEGAVAGIVVIDPVAEELTWGGIGNVEGVLWRADGLHRERLVVPGGILGRDVPLRSRSVPLLPGDVLLLSTDGI